MTKSICFWKRVVAAMLAAAAVVSMVSVSMPLPATAASTDVVAPVEAADIDECSIAGKNSEQLPVSTNGMAQRWIFALSEAVGEVSSIDGVDMLMRTDSLDWGFTREDMFLASWGDEPGQLGLDLGGVDRQPMGPQGVAIGSDGSVHILDSVNRRVQSFGEHGRYLDSMDLPSHLGMPVDLSFDSDGALHLLDSATRRVWRIQVGDEIHTSAIELGEAISWPRVLRAGGNRAIWVGGLDEAGVSDTPYSLRAAPVVSGTDHSLQHFSSASSGVPTLSGPMYPSLERLSEGVVRISISDSSSTEVLSTTLATGLPVGGIQVLDTDANGSVYLQMDFLEQSDIGALRVTSALVRFTATGQLQGLAELPASDPAKPNRSVTVGADGQVSYLWLQPDGAYLVRFSPTERSDDLPPAELLVHPLEQEALVVKTPDTVPETPVDSYDPAHIAPTGTTADVCRATIVANAERYLDYSWYAKATNLTSRTCSNGCPVGGSPWSVGYHTGVAYAWGGYDFVDGISCTSDCGTSRDYQWKLDNDRFVGDTATGCIPTADCTAGVDCSGFVSRVWQESRKTTSSLPGISFAIQSSELKAGDILNSTSIGHVVLFSHFDGGGQPVFYEATPPKVRVFSGWSYLNGYQPLRYNDVVDCTSGGCADYSHNGVVLFDSLDCGGTELKYSSPTGIEHLPSLGWNDRAQSLYVGSGWSVRVYQHDPPDGATRCIGPTKMWDLHGDYFENSSLSMFEEISSLQVFDNTSCTAPPQPCGKPTLTSPADGAVLSDNTVTFKWNALSGCTFSGYTFRVCTSSNVDNLANCFIDEGEGSTQRTETITGHDNQDVYWGVRAANAPDGASWAVHRFRIDPLTAPNPPAPQSPADGATFSEGASIPLAWSDTGDTYRGEYWGGPYQDPLTFGPQSQTTVSIGPLWAGHTYQWHVKAFNAVGPSNWSTTRSFIVKPHAPTNVSAQATSCTGAKLTWTDRSGGEEGYKIYRDGTYIGQVGMDAQTYQDSGLTGGSSYRYVVRAYRGSILSDASNATTVTLPACPPPAAPTGVQASDGTYADKVRITWNASGGASSYRVYRATSAGGARTLLGSPSSTVLDDMTAVAGTTYYYWVRACSASGCSGDSASDTGYRRHPLPATPAGVQASDGTHTDKVRVTWSPSSGATSYRVYRATAATAEKVYLRAVTGTSFDDITATAEARLTYWIRACNAEGCSAYSAGDEGWRRGVPLAPRWVQASDGAYTDRVQVSWEPMATAAYYNIYRAEGATWAKSYVGSATTTSYQDTTAEVGVRYYYFIKAANNYGKSEYSAYNEGWRNGIPRAPRWVQASDGAYTDRVQVSWEAVPLAAYYNIYRAGAPTWTKTYVGSATDASFADTTTVVGEKWYYFIKAASSYGKSEYSAYNEGWRNGIPRAPRWVQASDGAYTDRVQLSWEPMPAVAYYNVYRATSVDGSLVFVASATGTTWSDTMAVPGVLYYYAIKAGNSYGKSDYSVVDRGWRATGAYQ